MDLNFHCDAFLVLMSCEILSTFAIIMVLIKKTGIIEA